MASRPGPSGGTPERLLARSLARRLSEEGTPFTVTLRELRDGPLEGRRLTLKRRLALQRALEEAGVSCPIPLSDAGLDQPIGLDLGGEPPRRGRRRWLAHPVVAGTRGAVVFFVGTLGFIAALVTLIPLLDGDEPNRMSGDVNLVAAAFADSSGGADGQALAQSVTRSLRADVASAPHGPSAPDFEVRGPEGLGTPADAGEAEALAGRLNADVVVYGDIRRQGARTVIEPRLYVDPKRLLGAEELGGPYALSPIDAGYLPADNAVAARAQLRAALVHHLRGLSALSIGLGWFNAQQWSEASRWFGQAATAWPRGKQGAMARLFAGNAAGKLDRLDRARTEFVSALALDPDLDRARLGLAEVRLRRAQHSCDAGASLPTLQRVGRTLAAIRTSSSGGGLVDEALRLRATLGIGRVNLCVSQAALADRWDDAIHSFRSVIALGATNRDRFRTEIAEAHAGLGLALLPTDPSAPDARAAYLRARKQYAAARRLSSDPARRRAFSEMISFVDQRLERTRARARRSKPLVVPASGPTLFGSRDVPPAGVQRQMRYFMGGGALECDPPVGKEPAVGISWADIGGAIPGEKGKDSPHEGDDIVVCGFYFSAGEPLRVTLTRPDGRREVSYVKDQYGYFESRWVWGPRFEPGRYAVELRQSDKRATRSFELLPAQTPTYRILPSNDAMPTFFVVGLEPRARVRLAVYRGQDQHKNPYAEPVSEYLASVPIQAREDGTALIALRTSPDDPKGCYVVEIYIGRRVLNDMLGSFCLPYRSA